MTNNWKETTLGEVAVFNYGKGLSTENRKSGDVPVYGSSGITGFHNEALIAEAGYIIGRKGTVGSIHYSDKPFYPIDTVYYLTKQDIKCDFRFFYYLLHTLGLDKLNFDSAVPGLNRQTAYSLKITIPTTESEQKFIAAVLSGFDDKIELLRRQNKTLESIAQSIFKQAFLKDKSWDGNLSEYLKVQGGYAFKSEDFKTIGFAGIVKITNITMGVVDIANTQFVDEDIVRDIDEDKFRIRSGDFLIAMTGAEIGKIGVVERTERQIWLNQRVGKLVAKVPYGDIAGYLALRTREGQEHIIDAASGSAQANISSTGIEEMAFVFYSEKDTNSFGEKVKPLLEKITFNLSQIQTLSKLRDTLLPKLMKGEINVKA